MLNNTNLRIISIIYLLLLFYGNVYPNKNVDSLLFVLDNDIKKSYLYDNIKNKRIEKIRKMKNGLPSISYDNYRINILLYNEYKSYSSDSALYYLHENELIAKQLNDYKLMIETSLENVYILTRMGMYLEAKDKLVNIDRSKIDGDLLKRYYLYFKDIYMETAYAEPRNKYTSTYYRKLGMLYRDSLLMVLSDSDDIFYSERMFIAKENKNYNEALYWNNKRIRNISFGEPQYALLAYNNYNILQLMGKYDDSLYCKQSVNPVKSQP